VTETTPTAEAGEFGATLYIDANTLAFGGSVQPPSYGLHSLITLLPPEAAAFLGWIPDIAIDSVGVTFDPDSKAFGVYATAGLANSASPSAQLFIGDVPIGATTAFVVGITLTSSIELSATPLFGSMLSGISISNLTFSYASAAIPAGAITLPPPAPGNSPAYPQGPVLSFTLSDGKAEQHFVLSPSSAGPTPPTPPDTALLLRPADGDPPPPVAPIQWFPVQKSIGPLTIGRIGIVSGDDELGLALDASVQTTALGVDLTGFTLYFKPTTDISLSGLHVSLDGLAVNFSSGSLTIDGSLARTVIDVHGQQITEYDGAILIQAGVYGIAAVGSFAELDGSPSLFVFGMAKGQFGGPPAFFVTGLAAGFGYNRGLNLPAPNQVQDFPFVLMATQGSGYLPDPDAAAALAKLSQGGWVPPELGEYWVAAGVKFSSFQLVDAFALLIVQFGNELVIALLGIAAIALPKVGDRFAYAEMTLDAVLVPAQGTFQMTALLTPNSFVLYPDCRLTGGFAFWLWFGDNTHAGDFVVTLGGYNSAFSVPQWYPSVPRLGFSWNVSSDIHLGGGAYFALTPSCVMGGGELSLTFQSGDLKAWFDAHADFIMWWKPFYFDVSIGVSIGASYTLDLLFVRTTLTVELSADVDLWGPPLAGVAHVNWYIISFTININGGGSPSPPGTALDWQHFSDNFLPGDQTGGGSSQVLTDDPPASAVLRSRIDTGLTSSLDDDALWLVSADNLSLSTETVVPASSIVVTGPSGVPPVTLSGPAVGVYPMGSVALTSVQTLSLTRTSTGDAVDLSGWTWTGTVTQVPYSLWGTQNNGSATLSAATLPGLTGCTAVPPPPVLTGPAAFDLIDLSMTELHPQLPLPLPTGAPIDGSTTAPTVDPRAVVADTIAEPVTVAARDAAIAVLNQCGVGLGLASDSMTGLAGSVFASFQEPPMLGPVGSTGPRSSTPPVTAADRVFTAPCRMSATAGGPATGGGRVGPARPVPLAAFRHPVRQPRPAATEFSAGPAADLLGWRATGHAFDAGAGRRHWARFGGVDGAGRPQARLGAHTSSVWLLDPTRPAWLHSDGARPVRALALDHRYQLLDVVPVTGDGPVAVPAGTERLLLTGLADKSELSAGGPAPAGWHSGTRLLQLAAQAVVGTGCLIRPQAPRRVRLYRNRGAGNGSRDVGVITGAQLVADNQVETTRGSEPGWIDTWLPAGTRTVLVTVRPSGPAVADLASATGSHQLLVFPDGPAGTPPAWHQAGHRLAWQSAGQAGDGTTRLVAELPTLAGTAGYLRTRLVGATGWQVTGVIGNPVQGSDGSATLTTVRPDDHRRAVVTLA
jgi:hypothetical protein